MTQNHYVYIVECADDTFYTGYTTDVARRVDEHNAGNGATYTAGRRPVTLRYVEYHDTRSAAQSREHAVKSLSRGQKEQLVESPDEAIPVRLEQGD
jgi:putative endonuclease